MLLPIAEGGSADATVTVSREERGEGEEGTVSNFCPRAFFSGMYDGGFAGRGDAICCGVVIFPAR